MVKPSTCASVEWIFVMPRQVLKPATMIRFDLDPPGADSLQLAQYFLLPRARQFEIESAPTQFQRDLPEARER